MNQDAALYRYRIILRRVIDGDTVVVDIDLGFNVWLFNIILRLARINAPEKRGKDKKAGKESTHFLESLLNEKELFAKINGKGKYGRWLSEVFFLENNEVINANSLMVREGYAVKYEG